MCVIRQDSVVLTGTSTGVFLLSQQTWH